MPKGIILDFEYILYVLNYIYGFLYKINKYAICNFYRVIRTVSIV